MVKKVRWEYRLIIESDITEFSENYKEIDTYLSKDNKNNGYIQFHSVDWKIESYDQSGLREAIWPISTQITS